MPYQTFIVNATATFLATSLYANQIEISDLKNYKLTDNGYAIYNIQKTYSDFEHNNHYSSDITKAEVEMILNFANKLIDNAETLDNDIARIVNENIMDLLA